MAGFTTEPLRSLRRYEIIERECISYLVSDLGGKSLQIHCIPLSIISYRLSDLSGSVVNPAKVMPLY